MEGETLRRWREESGLQLDDLAFYVRQQLPEGRGVSRETIRRYEIGETPVSKMNVLVVLAIARTCGRTIDEIPPALQSQVEQLHALLNGDASSLFGLVAQQRLFDDDDRAEVATDQSGVAVAPAAA